MTTSKTELFASLANITKDCHIPEGFTHLGQIDKVYPEYETEAYRTDIWENQDGVRIATWDLGNTHCEFMCEGTLEALDAYLVAEDNARRDRVANVGNIIHFPVGRGLGDIPNLYDFSYRVETSDENGITVGGFDQVFPHYSYNC